VKDLIQSKKFRTMVLGGLAIVVIKVAGLKGVVIDEATAKSIADAVLGLAGAYILAQGAADFGKEGKIKGLLAGAAKVATSVSADEASSEVAEGASAGEEAPANE